MNYPSLKGEVYKSEAKINRYRSLTASNNSE